MKVIDQRRRGRVVHAIIDHHRCQNPVLHPGCRYRKNQKYRETDRVRIKMSKKERFMLESIAPLGEENQYTRVANQWPPDPFPGENPSVLPEDWPMVTLRPGTIGQGYALPQVLNLIVKIPITGQDPPVKPIDKLISQSLNRAVGEAMIDWIFCSCTPHQMTMGF
jgi:hypothetical protein